MGHEEEKTLTGGLIGTPKPDMVNHPPHYKRGPRILLGDCDSYGKLLDWSRSRVELGKKLWIDISCIEVIRWIPDMRLATAVKYIWRVGFGGKEPGNQAKDREDIEKAVWYLQDWLEFKTSSVSPAATMGTEIANDE